MKYFPDSMWEGLPTVDFRPRFFAETFIEKLSMNTPHFHQSRLMNIFSSCAEAIVYIEEYKKNDQNKAYLFNVLKEIENCWECDPVAKKLIAHIKAPCAQLFKSIESGNFSAPQLIRLRVLCRAILAHEDIYIETLAADLKKSLVDPTDLSKKGRITQEIYSLTSLYITHLLNRGYSPTYLYNRAALFTQLKGYGKRNFEQQFSALEERLRTKTSQYDVYFALRSNKPSLLLDIQDKTTINFSGKIPEFIATPHGKKMQKDFEANVVAQTMVESTDHVSASWTAKETLDKMLDAVTALELNPRIETSAICVAVSKNQNLTHTETLNINRLISLLSSEGGTYFSNSGTSILHVLSVLNEDGKEHLGRSLRYLRLARNSISLEQKLINLWISLESIYSDGDGGILSNITEYAPQIYAVTGIYRRICYIKKLLVDNSIAAPPKIKKEILEEQEKFSQSTSDEAIFKILQTEELCKELLESLGELHHLKFRLSLIHSELQGNKSIENRLKRSNDDVERQLRRIYFLRNKIAHTGHYTNIRPQLIIHLLDYIAVCYMAIASSAKVVRPKSKNSINDLIAAYKMGTEVVWHNAKSKEPILSLAALTPLPII
ncbi:hypothetical protein [Variovorax arabinosiphilus]|uniref:hypothetical protein n=1 Tax=Variovorax arabinosiphilus TaxID=3053498 RepID=UPI00257743C2|nr:MULTISPECIES: hypothetical protein [unclassified Variovorax]MDM0121679.1 hypothetical protein [Variovorax sp. J2L1-78]MDM0130740.1 hypothetical protein [Variovorax sp. J2L1-63]MDM0234442.1 hypothetical protein [Variovorax sp. J2R1-6]